MKVHVFMYMYGKTYACPLSLQLNLWRCSACSKWWRFA